MSQSPTLCQRMDIRGKQDQDAAETHTSIDSRSAHVLVLGIPPWLPWETIFRLGRAGFGPKLELQRYGHASNAPLLPRCGHVVSVRRQLAMAQFYEN